MRRLGYFFLLLVGVSSLGSCLTDSSTPCGHPNDIPIYLLEDASAPYVSESLRFLRSTNANTDTVELNLNHRDTFVQWLDACESFCDCYGESLVVEYADSENSLQLRIQYNHRHPEPLGYEVVHVYYQTQNGALADQDFYTYYSQKNSESDSIYTANNDGDLLFRNHLDLGILFFSDSARGYTLQRLL